MNINESMVNSLVRSLEMLKMTVADMSDVELLQRPVPGANNANWQIGHLIVAETSLMTKCGARMAELPAGFAERYAKETSTVHDASKLATKAALLEQFEKTRAATVAFAKTITSSQLDAPSPMPQMLPTVGDMLALIGAGHTFMHLGQIQVLRRKLGKPILF